MNIPFHRSNHTAREYAAVKRVLKSGWLTQGEEVAAFEDEFAAYVGAKYAVAVSSCTMALTLAVDITNASAYVKVPSLTFSASAMAIIKAGAKPNFVDVKDNYIGDYDDLPCEPSDDSYLVVHYSGVDASGNDSEATVHDCAHRVERDMWRDGLRGTACFSFYPTKQIAGAEGGMICTNDDDWADEYRTLRNHGRKPDTTEVITEGYKANMTDVQAALCRVQLAKLDATNARRAEIVAAYNDAFGLENTGLHLYPVQVTCNDRNRERLGNLDDAARFVFREELAHKGITTSIHYPPLHLMPAYKPYTKSLPNTERICERIVSLPLYPALTDKEVSYIIRTVRKYL